MNMRDTLQSLVRRWYVFLTGMILSLALGWTAYQVAPTPYEATGSVLLMPSEVTVGESGNPFLYLGGMTNAVDVLIRRSNAVETREQLMEQFEGAELTIARDVTTDSPIAVVTARASTAETALELRDVGLDVIRQNLDAMQDDLDIEDDLRISLRNVVVETEATEVTKTAVQLALVATAGGAIASFMLTGIIDGILTRRRGRHGRRPGEPDGSADSPGPEPTSSSDRIPGEASAGVPAPADPTQDRKIAAESPAPVPTSVPEDASSLGGAHLATLRP